MEEQLVEIKGIEVTLFRSLRAKSLNITIKPFTGVRISVPVSVSFEKAKQAATERIGWIRSHLSKMQQAVDLFTFFSLTTEFQTRTHHLEMIVSDSGILKSVVRNNKITVTIPQSINVEDAEVQNEIRKAIERAWRKEAKEYLPDRVKTLASKHKFQYKKVAIKNSKTRWGSCSYDNSINLSLNLMRLPNHLIDYVILHELVHTKVKNHSRDFWQLLDIVSGNAKKLDKEVKEYSIEIY